VLPCAVLFEHALLCVIICAIFDYVFLCATMRVSMCNNLLLCADICDNVLLSAAMCDYL
jgi:hypothetical protein